jgi:hypothetical protein
MLGDGVVGEIPVAGERYPAEAVRATGSPPGRAVLRGSRFTISAMAD